VANDLRNEISQPKDNILMFIQFKYAGIKYYAKIYPHLHVLDIYLTNRVHSVPPGEANENKYIKNSVFVGFAREFQTDYDGKDYDKGNGSGKNFGFIQQLVMYPYHCGTDTVRDFNYFYYDVQSKRTINSFKPFGLTGQEKEDMDFSLSDSD
jgi:hypothetical protein